MKTFAFATIIFALIAVTFGGRVSTGLEPRIAGGFTALPGEFPYVVSLRVYFQHFCGGSILSNRWVLTTAHCIIRKRADEISVIAGTNLLAEAGQLYQAIFKTEHSQYDSEKLINDIGLILVSRLIVFTPKIQPVRLPIENFNKINYTSIFVGWGTKTTDGNYAEDLQKILLPTISQALCASLLSDITNTQICTLANVGRGACWGDAGGPLIADGYQIGILSYGTPCAKGNPDVFTRVWSFVEWIRMTIRDNSMFGVSHN